MTAIAIIPARGNSRRIPHKNIRPFHGKPIIAYSIEAAKASGLFSHVVVSTDDRDVSDVACAHGALVLRREPEFSEDHIGTQEVMRHVLSANAMLHGAEYACCIYPCAPMLDPQDLRRAAEQCERNNVSYVVPIGEWLTDPGMFYYGVASAFLLPMPLLGAHTELMPVDPRRCCDINTEADWLRAEAMYAELHRVAR